MNAETEEQIAVATFLDYIGLKYNASCAGMNSTRKQGAIHKKMGAKKGFHDLMIFDKTKCGKVGLTIEMKSLTGRPTKEQIEWQEYFLKRGWASHICKGRVEAFEIIGEYYPDHV